jgi:hypothetical protein
MKYILFLFLLIGTLPKITSAQKFITDIFPDLHNIHKWNSSNGDTWDPFWADDDNLYTFNCDGRGFGSADKTNNMSFNVLRGYKVTDLFGSLLNRMDEYGKGSELGADSASWKALGQECIDGIFYTFVSRHTYGNMSGDYWLRQTAKNASLIKSIDKGISWARSASENYKHPMWLGDRFGAPFFVHYGKDGGQVTKDGADKYVYAISNNGFWDDGDDYIIGRVLRTKLPSLNASDWFYFAGVDTDNQANWVNDINKATAILSLPKQCGSGPACYIPSLGVYLMVAWYSTERLSSWFEPTGMTYDFYQAEHPWGPWKFVSSLNDDFLGGQTMYGPSLCAKFQEINGTEVKISMFTSGCPFEDEPKGIYKMWEIPLILKTTPAIPSKLINDDNENIHYEGNWNVLLKQRDANYKGDLHYSSSKNDFLEFSFNGTGIEYLAQKDSRSGQVAIFLDGSFIKNESLKIINFPRISKIKVLTVNGLKQGNHTIKIVNISNNIINVDGFCIFE